MSEQKKMVVLGAGESGVGAAILATKMGIRVLVSDAGIIKDAYKLELNKRGIQWEEGKHSEDLILDSDEVVKSPGITEKMPLLKKIHTRGIPVISEIEFGSRYTSAKLICITGSNGKTTTTLLTYHILKKAGLNVGLAGNIGKSFAWQVAERDCDYFVLELSSFQLDGMFNFRADIAVLLNITPDHMDRYDYDMQKYTDSKFRIIQNQTSTDHFIYCADDEVISREISKRKINSNMIPFSIKKQLEVGAYLDNQEIIFQTTTKPFTMSILNLALRGKHNIYNSMAAGLPAQVLNIRKQLIRESLMDFQNVEHRLEFVATVHGIEFINDSKATNVNSTWYALESITKPVILILGGVDKGNDYSMLMELVKEKVKAIVCLGKDNEKIHKAFSETVPNIFDAMSAEEAVGASFSIGKQGDVVLLSPACASFDLFQNYEDRGRKFKNAVRAL